VAGRGRIDSFRVAASELGPEPASQLPRGTFGDAACGEDAGARAARDVNRARRAFDCHTLKRSFGATDSRHRRTECIPGGSQPSGIDMRGVSANELSRGRQKRRRSRPVVQEFAQAALPGTDPDIHKAIQCSRHVTFLAEAQIHQQDVANAGAIDARNNRSQGVHEYPGHERLVRLDRRKRIKRGRPPPNVPRRAFVQEQFSGSFCGKLSLHAAPLSRAFLACGRNFARKADPSLPDAAPLSDRPRCGGRESKFLAASGRRSLPDLQSLRPHTRSPILSLTTTDE